MIFLKVDDTFCELMQQYARNRLLVDCGAGEGLFQSMMPRDRVLSLDIRVLEEQHAPVLFKDCIDFPFTRSTIPMFIRPCHSGFVHDTIVKNLGVVDSFLYVSMPENVGRDLDESVYRVDHIYPEWEGPDGEYIYKITSRESRGTAMTTYSLIKRTYPQSTWWYIRDGVKITNNVGGYTFLGEGDKVLEEAEAEDFESLDWEKTTLLVPDSDAGWLDRNGKFFGCDSKDHDTLAYYILKKETRELEQTGWVRVYGEPGSSPEWTQGRFESRLSADQRNWLSLHGYRVEEED